ncbi:MAG: radical SAM protein, partial [Chloroflexota bacterium]|nr:radical SAM protein [Chloroflexota bacterium]
MDLMEAFRAYPNIEKAIIIKSDMLRLGTRVSPALIESMKDRKDIRFKGYALFSYDRGKAVVRNEKIPVHFYIEDGTHSGTMVQVRAGEDTPYVMDFIDGEFVVTWNGEVVCKINRFTPRPNWLNRQTEDGTPFEALVYNAGEDLLFVVANKHCDYFNQDKQCLFCDLSHQAATQKAGGETVVLRKRADTVGEVLEIALHEKSWRHIMITGGTFLRPFEGKEELDWYIDFLNAIRKRIICWYPAAFQINALDEESWKRLHDTGIPTIQPNIEVWGKELFETICPGKSERIGWDDWLQRTINAVKYWGPGNVNPNFVSGVEMAQPYGFPDAESAVKHTLDGFNYLMEHGVLPRTDFWCIEEHSK